MPISDATSTLRSMKPEQKTWVVGYGLRNVNKATDKFRINKLAPKGVINCVILRCLCPTKRIAGRAGRSVVDLKRLCAHACKKKKNFITNLQPPTISETNKKLDAPCHPRFPTDGPTGAAGIGTRAKRQQQRSVYHCSSVSILFSIRRCTVVNPHAYRPKSVSIQSVICHFCPPVSFHLQQLNSIEHALVLSCGGSSLHMLSAVCHHVIRKHDMRRAREAREETKR